MTSLLFVHAHPDDETITTGGTIARYARAGADVTVVTCTLGEEGEVIGARWAGLVAGAADQLGGYRIHELRAALEALGAPPPRFLGGAGRWRDSGMAGTPSAAHPRAFVNADVDEAVTALVEIFDEVRPDVVVTYDPNGGYGHPDHIQAHRVTMAAAAQRPPAKLYWTVTDADVLGRALRAMGPPAAGWRAPDPGELASVPSESVTTSIDVSGVLDAKVAALRAHATQVSVAESGTEFALSNAIVQPILDTEHYIRIGAPERAGRDLLDGLDGR